MALFSIGRRIVNLRQGASKSSMFGGSGGGRGNRGWCAEAAQANRPRANHSGSRKVQKKNRRCRHARVQYNQHVAMRR